MAVKFAFVHALRYLCNMRRLFTILMLLAPLTVFGQKVAISGIVADERTGEPLPQATVSTAAGGHSTSVVTNEEGFFTLKTDDAMPALSISHLGYQTRRVEIPASPPPALRILLRPTSIALHEIMVWTEDARRLVDIAIGKIADNYSRHPELYNCFYRETAMKRQHYIYVAEGIVDMYKTAYDRPNTLHDRAAIVKGRRLVSPRQSDTLGVKVIGGPVLPIQLDLAKNPDLLLNESDLAHYAFRMEVPTSIDGRLQYVVSIEPNAVLPYALYHGRLYIDRETLAFTRAELSLDMDDREKATRFMLVRKPAGVRFRPKELSTLIDYRTENGVTRISYVRSTIRFNCDWRRRLFATSFTACCEMVVTSHTDRDIRPISGRDSFDRRDAFYDRVDYFLDPSFWADYNIIEPTETLDRAIDKLIKKHR